MKPLFVRPYQFYFTLCVAFSLQLPGCGKKTEMGDLKNIRLVDDAENRSFEIWVEDDSKSGQKTMYVEECRALDERGQCYNNAILHEVSLNLFRQKLAQQLHIDPRYWRNPEKINKDSVTSRIQKLQSDLKNASLSAEDIKRTEDLIQVAYSNLPKIQVFEDTMRDIYSLEVIELRDNRHLFDNVKNTLAELDVDTQDHEYQTPNPLFLDERDPIENNHLYWTRIPEPLCWYDAMDIPKSERLGGPCYHIKGGKIENLWRANLSAKGSEASSIKDGCKRYGNHWRLPTYEELRTVERTNPDLVPSFSVDGNYIQSSYVNKNAPDPIRKSDDRRYKTQVNGSSDLLKRAILPVSCVAQRTDEDPYNIK